MRRRIVIVNGLVIAGLALTWKKPSRVVQGWGAVQRRKDRQPSTCRCGSAAVRSVGWSCYDSTSAGDNLLTPTTD
jgi:hypothetical protein